MTLHRALVMVLQVPVTRLQKTNAVTLSDVATVECVASVSATVSKLPSGLRLYTEDLSETEGPL